MNVFPNDNVIFVPNTQLPKLRITAKQHPAKARSEVKVPEPVKTKIS